jgi:DNA ligase-1
VKYDGTRGFWLESENDGRPVSGFFSRAGLPLEVPPTFAKLVVKFLEEVKGYAFHPESKLFLDCEIVSLKGGFADVMSQVRASKRGASEGTTGIRIIDILTEEEYQRGISDRDQRARRHLLEDVIARPWFTEYAEFIALTEGEEVKDDLQVQAFYQKVLAGGGEGAMFKLYEGFWEGKRSNAWQKIKPREKTSGIVVGWKPGAKGSKWDGHLGAVQVRLESGVKVFVGGMTDKTRDYLLDNIEMLIAQEVEVEVGFHEVTPDGSLRHPRIGLVRDDK